MALARVQYEQTVVGNTSFVVTFPYISTDHVKVSVDGVAAAYTWLNTSTISLTVAPAVGAIIDIVRETDRVDMLVDFADASTLRESQLDLAAKQVFYLSQEAFDLTNSTLAVADDGSYSASGRRISLLGYPDSSDDAANKEYVDDVLTSGYDAFVQATAAANSASQAASSASSASTSATNAATSESNAANSASSASTSETNAAASAATAASLLDSFDDRYLGAKASDPATDNDGDPLLDGALYWNTAVNALRVYGGSVWNQFAYDPANVAITGGAASGLSELSVSPNSSGNVSREVMRTAPGGDTTEDGVGTWAKLADITFDGGTLPNAFVKCTLLMQGVRKYSGPETMLADVILVSNGTNITVGSSIEVLSITGQDPMFSRDSLLVVADSGTAAELWLRKDTTFGGFTVIELGREIEETANINTLTYNDGAAWQSTAPTGTETELASDWAGKRWAVPSMLNAWVYQQGRGYTRLPNGLVVVDLRLSGGADDTVAFTFPEGYRPGTHTVFRVQRGATTSEANGTCYVSDTGNVTISNAGGTTEWINLQFSFMEGS